MTYRCSLAFKLTKFNSVLLQKIQLAHGMEIYRNKLQSMQQDNIPQQRAMLLAQEQANKEITKVINYDIMVPDSTAFC